MTPTHEEMILRILAMRGAAGATNHDIERLAQIPFASRRILDLRRKGYAITTEWTRSPNGARIARYVWQDEAGIRLGVAS